MRYWILAGLLLTACQGASSADNVQQAMREAEKALPSPVASASASPVESPAARSHVLVGGQRVEVEVAATAQSRATGLSGRPSLAKNTGLVLYWDTPEPTAIWMPDMNFAIDVIFVRDGRIVFIKQNAQPCPSRSDCPTFGPTTPVNYVLEVPAGSVAEWKVKVGDTITLNR